MLQNKNFGFLPYYKPNQQNSFQNQRNSLNKLNLDQKKMSNIIEQSLFEFQRKSMKK